MRRGVGRRPARIDPMPNSLLGEPLELCVDPVHRFFGGDITAAAIAINTDLVDAEIAHALATSRVR